MAAIVGGGEEGAGGKFSDGGGGGGRSCPRLGLYGGEDFRGGEPMGGGANE